MTSKEEKKVVLVVDDQPNNIDILREILAPSYKVKAALNGEQALEIAINQPLPDLVLLDIMMPEMDGYEICQKLKNNKLSCDIPVIFVTAMHDTADEEKGFQCGAVDYITKPVSPPLVKARVANHLFLKSKRDELERQVGFRTCEIEEALKELKNSQEQIIQQEKLATIGQLTAGVAHELNNPTAFISSNLNSLNNYVDKLHQFLEAVDQVTASATEPLNVDLQELRKKLKIDFILEDIKDLCQESSDGLDRIKKIVTGLKNFSRKDQENDCDSANINDCLECTIQIVWNELKYKAEVVKDYGELPGIICFPNQLSQVFMNLLVNAAHAIVDHGTITIKTRYANDTILVNIADTGSGIAPENLNKIFEPFFTTKKLGKGTGLGMSIAAEIIKNHGGEISVESELGKGTLFTVKLPVKREE